MTLKIAFCSDTHITDKRPENRIDDFYETLTNKLNWIIDESIKTGCEVLIIAGDVFDSHNTNRAVIQDIIQLFRSKNIRFLCVAGQHDQKFHNPDLRGTALGILLAAKSIELLRYTRIFGNVAIQGVSWKESINEPIDGYFNVLVIHKMIIDDKLWAAQEGHEWANHLLMKHKYDLIISGDNHKPFIAKIGKRTLVNCGSMMRLTIAQADHEPRFYSYDTTTMELATHYIPMESIDTVMQVAKCKKEKEKLLAMTDFIRAIRGSGSSTAINFIDRLHNTIANIDESVKTIIEETLQ